MSLSLGRPVLIDDAELRPLAYSTQFGELDAVRTASILGRLAPDDARVALFAEGIRNATAPVHIAAAVGTPVVDLYALTNPQHVPWRVPHRVLYRDVPCRYCYKSVCPAGHHDCLAQVRPAEIADAIRALVDATFEPVRATLDALPRVNLERGGPERAQAL